MNTVAQPAVLMDVKTIVEETLKFPVGKLDVEAEFESFGMDSIIAMELMTNLSKRLNISITPAMFAEVSTVEELANEIDSIIGSSAINNDSRPVKASNGRQNQEKYTGQIEEKIHGESVIVDRKPLGRRTLRSEKVSGNTSFQKIIDFIMLKYSIDFNGAGCNTIDQIVDALVTIHYDELEGYYGRFDIPVSEESNVERSRHNGDIMNTHKYSTQQVQKSAYQSVSGVAIVGLSCRFPDAPDANAFWSNLTSRKNSIREIPRSRWDWNDYYSESVQPNKTVSKWGAFLDDIDCFDAEFFNISPQQASLMDPQERIFLQEVYKAFQDAGIGVDKSSGSNTGVFVGYEYSEYEHYLRDKTSHTEGGFAFSSSSPTYYLANRLSYLFNFQGPSESINTNCASSAVAIHRAYYSLLNGECDTAVAGGVCLNLFSGDYIAGSQYGMLSSNGTCAVFDNNANGFTRGEGVGVIIMKRLEDARKANNRVYSVIKGCHQNNRGGARNISEIKHESITDVIENCYSKFSVLPETVDYIEVDGYSTKWGDSFEFEGIKNIFKDCHISGKTCALGSVKGNIGHLEPASGIASVIKVALSLYRKRFPATITKNKLNEFIDINNPSHPLYIADEDIEFSDIRRGDHTPVRAGVNSFADSGVNVHILLEEDVIENSKEDTVGNSRQEIFTLSAKSYERLQEYIQVFIDYLSGPGSKVSFSSINYSLQVGREALSERLAVIAHSFPSIFFAMKCPHRLTTAKRPVPSSPNGDLLQVVYPSSLQ